MARLEIAFAGALVLLGGLAITREPAYPIDPVPAMATSQSSVAEGVFPDIQKVEAHEARISRGPGEVAQGAKAWEIEFAAAERPRVVFSAGAKAWDWRAYGALAFDLVNPGDEDVAFAFHVSDAAPPVGGVRGRTAYGKLAAHQTKSFCLLVGKSDPQEFGMRGGPPGPVEELMTYASHRLDASRITDFEVSLYQNSAPRRLVVENIRLLPPTISYDGIVDAFGQFAAGEWPGKLEGAEEFARRRAKEEAEIKTAPTLPDRDEYGGWAAGPQVAASGFFSTTKRDGKWWLVTPSGHLFLSLGIDAINTNDGFTFVDGREKLFTWLPEKTDPLSKHYGYADHVHSGPVTQGRTFNFYSANLERKYGADYMERWRAHALDRLRAWGFNTVANWSDPELFGLKRVPYTPTIDLSGDYAHVSSGHDYWGKMHDPFDPKFAEAVDQGLRTATAKYRDDPWCLGYFVDNEVSWGGGSDDCGHYGLAYGALASGADQPAKKAFVRQLKDRYREIGKMNEAWGTEFKSWESLLSQPWEPPDTLAPHMREDFSSFLRAFARQYFRTIREALKKHDPNHLYLGCRFAWRTPEAVEASAEYCDVVSFNIYRQRVDAEEWGFTRSLNKPCIIGEFHFGARDRGMFHTGLVSLDTQEARAAMYRDYIHSVVDNPAFVGCHWFQYFDEPLVGRSYDGENYNIGFVDVTDTPYPEMVAAAKAAHAEAYRRRAAGQ
jgi:hypothetical protein